MADESREKLVEKARVEYGITNADSMSDEQLKSEMQAVDQQHPDAVRAQAKANQNKDSQKKKKGKQK